MKEISQRKFAIPYNFSEVEEYLKIIEPYKNNIDSIYFGLPSMLNMDNEDYSNFQKLFFTEKNSFDFLSATKYTSLKRLLVVNSCSTIVDDKFEHFLLQHLYKLQRDYNLQGVIVANYSVGLSIHREFPNLEIQTSCRSFNFSSENLERWKNDLNVSVFNGPRDATRNPRLLKELKSTGYKFKYLVNDLCICGCPDFCHHFLIRKNKTDKKYCDDAKFTDCLKSSFILPQWYDYYDDYVDVYKISGRHKSNKFLSDTLDCFINCNTNKDFFDVVCCFFTKRLKDYAHGKELPIKNISRKLIDCEQKNCEQCKICENTIIKYLKNANVENINYEI